MSFLVTYLFLYNQNTQEKFDAEPEDCDQKEMYKLLVSFIQTLRKKKNKAKHETTRL